MKKLKRTLYTLASIAAIIAMVAGIFMLRPVPGLMEQAGLPLTCIRGFLDAATFTDWLAYTDGYDYAVLRVDPRTFVPPENWTRGEATAEEINPAPEGLGCSDFHPDFYRDAPLPETFTAWHFEPRDLTLPFSEQAFFAAMYDERSGVLALYRGHSFYGSP